MLIVLGSSSRARRFVPEGLEKERSPRMSRQRRTLVPWLFILPGFGFLLLVGLYPLVFTFVTSFERYHLDTIYLGTPFVGFDNYIDSLRSSLFIGAMLRTGFFVLVALPVEMVLGLGIAFLLDRPRNDGLRAFTRVILVLPIATTPVVVGLFGALIFNTQFGVVNYLVGLAGIRPVDWLGSPTLAMVSVFALQVWQWTPFVALVMLATLATIPVEMEDAFFLESNSWLKRLRHIRLPYLIPGLTAAAIFQTAYMIKLFDMIYTLTRGGPGESTDLISLQMERLSFRAFDAGQAAAESVIMLVVTLVLSQLYIRFFYREPEA